MISQHTQGGPTLGQPMPSVGPISGWHHVVLAGGCTNGIGGWSKVMLSGLLPTLDAQMCKGWANVGLPFIFTFATGGPTLRPMDKITLDHHCFQRWAIELVLSVYRVLQIEIRSIAATRWPEEGSPRWSYYQLWKYNQPNDVSSQEANIGSIWILRKLLNGRCK